MSVEMSKNRIHTTLVHLKPTPTYAAAHRGPDQIVIALWRFDRAGRSNGQRARHNIIPRLGKSTPSLPKATAILWASCGSLARAK